MKTRTSKKTRPQFECLSCGTIFYSEAATIEAIFGRGCPGCGGHDVDVYDDLTCRCCGRPTEEGNGAA